VKSVSWGVNEEEGSKLMMVEVLLSVTMIWLGPNGGPLTCSKTNDEDEAKVVPVWVGTSFTTCSVIICSGSARLSVVSVEGWATLMGWTLRICSSDLEKCWSETDCSWNYDLFLAMFLSAMPKDMFEWFAFRWYGWYSGWIISSVQVFVAISELGSCCWGFYTITSSEANFEAFSEFGSNSGN